MQRSGSLHTTDVFKDQEIGICADSPQCSSGSPRSSGSPASAPTADCVSTPRIQSPRSPGVGRSLAETARRNCPTKPRCLSRSHFSSFAAAEKETSVVSFPQSKNLTPFCSKCSFQPSLLSSPRFFSPNASTPSTVGPAPFSCLQRKR